MRTGRGVHVVKLIGESDFFLLPRVGVFIFAFLVVILVPGVTIPERGVGIFGRWKSGVIRTVKP